MRPLGLVLHGISGVGKTELAANFPNVGCIHDPQEQGIHDLLEFNRCPDPVFIEEVESFANLMEVSRAVAKGKHKISTLFYDSTTGLELLAQQQRCAEYFDDDWNRFTDYAKGPKDTAKTEWVEFIDVLDLVRASGINVIVIAHSRPKDFNNPEGENFQRWSPYMDQDSWQRLGRWAQTVLFYNFHVDTVKKGTRFKADEETQARHLCTEWSPAYDAKNKAGLSPIIEAGESGKEAYDNFKQDYLRAIKRSRK